MDNQNKLTKNQISALKEIITEQLSDKVSYESVSEYALILLENIAGFEILTESEQQEIIHDIWTDISKKRT